MSWGYKIIIAYLLFMIMIFYFLFVAFQQKNEMVEENYYEKEMEFQHHYNAERNLIHTGLKPDLEIRDHYIKIKLPASLSSTKTKGYYRFLRLSDKSKDINSSFQTDTTGIVYLESDLFIPGTYQFTIQWSHNDQSYLYKDPFTYMKP